MKIVSRLQNRNGTCNVSLSTNDVSHELVVEAKDDGKGFRTNGGELLCLALASCFCNDIYREAKVKGIDVIEVEVEVEAEFGGIGEPAKAIEYNTSITAQASKAEIQKLVEHTDALTEIQNTLRQGMPVKLVSFKAKSVA